MAFRARTTSISALQSKIKAKTEKPKDERFFVPTPDKENLVQVIFRFLPSPDSDAVVETREHYFKVGEKTIRENCIKSDNSGPNMCPICRDNAKDWNDDNKSTYSTRKAKSKYICNIGIIKDLGNPHNVGKVFLYEFKNSINNKIIGKIAPKTALEEAINVFDYFEGANFKLIGLPDTYNNGVKDIPFMNYETSAFYDKSALTQELAEKFDTQLFELSSFCSDTKHKSIAELEAIVATYSTAKVKEVLPTIEESAVKQPTQPEPVEDNDEDWLNSLRESIDN